MGVRDPSRSDAGGISPKGVFAEMSEMFVKGGLYGKVLTAIGFDPVVHYVPPSSLNSGLMYIFSPSVLDARGKVR